MQARSEKASPPADRHPEGSRQPLSGLRILEITDTPSAAFATVLLADLGATVIVCEPPEGSGLRRLGPAAVRSIWWPILARNKASISLDWADPGGVDTLVALLNDCDLVVRDRSVPMLDEALARVAESPQDLLIVPTGADRRHDWPWSTAPELAEAASGLMALTGFSGEAPTMPELPLASHTTAMLASAAALFERRAAHLANRVPAPLQFAQHEALMRMIEWQLPVAQAQGRAELRNGNRFPMNSNIGNIFRCADGTLLTISAATASVADRLLTLIGGEALRQDPRFATATARQHNMDALEARIAQWMASRTGREAVEQMRAHDTVVGTIDDAATLVADSHVAARGGYVRIAHGVERLPMPAPLPRMVPSAGRIWRAGVAPGADNATILERIGRFVSPWSIDPDTCEGDGLPRQSGRIQAERAATAPRSAEPLPLQGLRVLELGSVIAAPFAASLLADLGAEVIKVEQQTGDALRNMGLRDEGVSLWWGVASRAKQLCVMDLKAPDDRARLLSLVDQADVLIENNRPGVMARLGLGWESLHVRNPRLIMLSISGFGQNGPYASRPGFGKIAEAFSGLVSLTGDPGAIPLHVGFSLADTLAGLVGVLGIAEVLHERDVGGTARGRWIDLALYEPLLRINECQTALAERLGRPPCRTGSADPWSFGASGPDDRRLIPASCADGDWLVAIVDGPALQRLHSAGFDDLNGCVRRLARPTALAHLMGLGIEAAPVQDGASLAREPYFALRGDVRRVIDQADHTRVVPGVTPRGYDDQHLRGFDAQPLDPNKRSPSWRLID